MPASLTLGGEGARAAAGWALWEGAAGWAQVGETAQQAMRALWREVMVALQAERGGGAAR